MYLLEGLHNGIRISLEAHCSQPHSTCVLPSITRPSLMPTSRLKSYVVGLRALQPPFTDLHISRFGKVPKSNQPRKWRLILDLASPDGHSVNDGISKTPFSL